MASTTLLSELQQNVQRLRYTIDDIYAQNKLLTWQDFLQDLQEDMQAMQALFPKVKNPLLLIQRYYEKYVDRRAIVAECEREVAKSAEQIAAIEQQIATNEQTRQGIQQALVQIDQQITTLRTEIDKYKRLSTELQHEQQVLSPLTDKTKYKKLYKEIEQQASQYNIGILECEAAIADSQKQADALRRDEATCAEHTARYQADVLALQAQIAQLQARQAQALTASDYQEEIAAYDWLLRFFKVATQYKNKDTGEDYTNADASPYIIDESFVPKNWRSVLEKLCRQPLPTMSGFLRDGAPYKSLQRQELPEADHFVAALFLSLRAGLQKGESIQSRHNKLFLPLGGKHVLQLSFRQKGRIIDAFSQSAQIGDEASGEEIEENATRLDIFSRDGGEHRSLYVLFAQYVVLLDILSNPFE